MKKRAKPIALSDNDEIFDEDIFSISYETEIEKAVAAGNYRKAIRFMFLRVLKNMADRNIIQYRHDKTNLDYLLQLQGTKYYDDFFRTVRDFEYSWYGQFDITREVYEKVKNDFIQFNRNKTRD